MNPTHKHPVYLPYGKYLRFITMGYDQIIADVLWLRSIQYIGDKSEEKRGYPHLYSLLDLVTDIDPKFVLAYRVGGVILSVWAGKVEESNRLLKKGFKHNPDDWRLPFFIGFNNFFYLRNFHDAAYYIGKASIMQGSPPYLTMLASRLYAEAEVPEFGIEFLWRVYENTVDKRVRNRVLRRMKELIVERDVKNLELALKRYKEKTNVNPKELQELITKGIIESLPKEPYGGYYYLDQEDGRVKSSKKKEKLRIHRKKESLWK
ncbi:MAG: hypothetical protein SVW57_04185 [Thermodesulfobacteriota bacterium]|nr:hypothetical protein [Thermodesulfobacteriota bacterium]